jgi:replication factor C large subunit
VEHDPATYVSELMLDADQLNFFLHDKARSQEIIKFLLREEKDKAREKEPQKKPPKEKVRKSDQPAEEPAPEEPPAPPGPAEKKQPSRSQSTLFDGF